MKGVNIECLDLLNLFQANSVFLDPLKQNTFPQEHLSVAASVFCTDDSIAGFLQVSQIWS